MIKHIYILRGVPGAGKSTYIKNTIEPKHLGIKVKVFSADHFFVNSDGVYQFNPRYIGDAHSKCKKDYADCLWAHYIFSNMEDIAVVVDNTNILTWEAMDYVAMANDHGIPYTVVTISTNPDIAASRCVHGVPADKVAKMYEKMMKDPLPSNWNKITV